MPTLCYHLEDYYFECVRQPIGRNGFIVDSGYVGMTIQVTDKGNLVVGSKQTRAVARVARVVCSV